jgi:hypothetical protein
MSASITTSLEERILPTLGGEAVGVSGMLGALAGVLLAATPTQVGHTMHFAVNGFPRGAYAAELERWRVAVARGSRTRLGSDLRALRARIVASGEKLLNSDEIAREVADRRGERA